MTWSHTPNTFILVWISLALPFTIWDNLYLQLRPHTLPGEKWHSPIFKVYTAYSTKDRMYSREAYEARDGFAPAHALMNLVETFFYAAYFVIVFRAAKNGDERRVLRWYWRPKIVSGRDGVVAVWIGLIGGVMTASKTVLCFLTEMFSGWHYTGHNTLFQQLTGWMFMVILYFSASVYMSWHFSAEILRGLSLATGSDRRPSKKHR